MDIAEDASVARTQHLTRKDVTLEPSTLHMAKIALRTAFSSFAILALVIIAPLFSAIVLDRNINTLPFGSPTNIILISYAPHLLLFLITVISTIVGYRLLVASGARARVVIPDQDYDLLAPLVSEGKAEAVDQYVRLSSLTGFTGTFTKLGMTGLPLATIGLTVVFAVLALFKPDEFLDLTKLTLGAFIGSFVQRQVETRAGSKGSSDQSKSLGA